MRINAATAAAPLNARSVYLFVRTLLMLQVRLESTI
jgi:hypothetical protein